MPVNSRHTLYWEGVFWLKNLRKNYALVIALLLCISVLAACSREAGQPSDNRESIVESSAGQESTESAAAEDSSENSSYDSMAVGAYEDGSHPEFSGVRLRLTINNGEEVIISLYDNTAVDALLERLPLENLLFFDLSGIEKPIEQLDEPLSPGEEEPGYDPVTGEMVIYRPWANFTIFYGDFRYSDELVPLGKVESGLEIISSQTEDFTGTLELAESE